MSEKHLSETPWKILVSKTQVKDTGLQKALSAYLKVDAAKDAAQTLAALEEIGVQAVKVKKAGPVPKEVTAYLDEVLKEVNKTRPGLAALAKPLESKAEANAETETTDLKERLMSALKRVKAGEGEDSIGFLVCVAKPCYGVLLARNAHDRLGSSHKKELAELTKGTRFIEGKCVFEKGAHTFVVETVPPGLAKNLKRALKQYTGLILKVRVRDMEGKVVADADTDADPEETASVTGEAPSAPPRGSSVTIAAGVEDMAKFTARFKALQPDLVQAIAARTPRGDEAKQRAVEAGALANKKDFARANQLLSVVESLLKIAAAPAAPVATPAANGAFQNAWAVATSHLHEAVDTVREQLAVFARALMASGEENLIWIAEDGLSQVFSSLRDAALTIDRATSKLPARVIFKARPAIDNLKHQITGPRVLACDQNQLGVSVTIRETIAKAIQELETALELAKA